MKRHLENLLRIAKKRHDRLAIILIEQRLAKIA